MKKTSAIVAMTPERVIGCSGKIPWHLPSDLARFRKITLGGAVIMGRKTWESLPDMARPLTGRENIVVTRRSTLNVPSGVVIARSLAEALSTATNERIFIIGGGTLYAEAIEKGVVSEVLMTTVYVDVSGDTYFPLLPPHEWWEVVSAPDTQNPGRPASRFTWYSRVQARD